MAGSNETTCNDKSAENPLHATNSREFRYLFKLPPELRLSIYRHHFLSTRLSYGLSIDLDAKTIPARHSLALLRTCRRVRTEIGDTWLGHVLFNFADVDYMMVILKALPMATLSKIRHVRILGTELCFFTDLGEHDAVSYTLVQALKLLPGLQLDTFTVLSPGEDDYDYEVLNDLIEYGDGWKELRFICQVPSQLGYKSDNGYRHKNSRSYPRKPQPAHWASVMNTRDGIQNQPSVTIYQSVRLGEPCSVMHEATRVIIEQWPWKEKEHVTLAEMFSATYFEKKEEALEVMVVVKRGKGINYQEGEHPRYLTAISDIRKDFPHTSWAEIKSRFLRWSDDGTYHGSYCEHRKPPLMDIYKHVQEYTWRELRMKLCL
ncbi:hypothetical protein X797_008010 [Metarhizium robertsii]|uniref:Uncharacterized protein n=1 Tax=Metarhizium robertsii TaxID=568076 RepID=A0A0A1UT39_9HYPO|nr:hypothetical protein X797_008010 [Metarhizium robertsii]